MENAGWPPATGWVQIGATTAQLICGYNAVLGGVTTASPPNAAALQCTNGAWAVAHAPYGTQPAQCVSGAGRRLLVDEGEDSR